MSEKISVTLIDRFSAIICCDRAQAFRGGRDLDVEVGRRQLLVERAGGGLGAGAVAGEPGIDLDRDVAVEPVGLVVDRTQDVERRADVAGDELPVGRLDVEPAADGAVELLVVLVGALDRLLEDRRVRGEPTHTTGDPVLEFAAGDPAAADVVEPGALTLLGEEIVQPGHGSSGRDSGLGRIRIRAGRGPGRRGCRR